MRALQELTSHRDFATTLIYAGNSASAHEAGWAEAAFGGRAAEASTNQRVLRM